MDWLSRHRVLLDCPRARVHISRAEQILFAYMLHEEELLDMGSKWILGRHQPEEMFLRSSWSQGQHRFQEFYIDKCQQIWLS
ncbi:hypothetical protein YC2023_089224 [Brassica napus]